MSLLTIFSTKFVKNRWGRVLQRLSISFVAGALAALRQGSDYTSHGASGHAQILGVQTYSL
jgi:hypothetical protein